jgi:hypothetical protein
MANKTQSSKDPKTIYGSDDTDYPAGFIVHPDLVMDPEGDDPENSAGSSIQWGSGPRPTPSLKQSNPYGGGKSEGGA